MEERLPIVKVVTGEEMARIDRVALEEYGLPGAVLMENAGRAVAEAALALLARTPGHRRRIHILCGAGNNGGDGYVAARYLINAGARVRLYSVGAPRARSDARLHWDVLRRMGVEPMSVTPQDDGSLETVRLALGMGDLIIDALLGTGFKGALRAPFPELIEAVNGAGKPVLAVDIPSGVPAGTGQFEGGAIQATETVTFALPKVGLLFYPGAATVGRLTIADIGLPAPLLRGAQGFTWVTPELAGQFWPSRPRDAHKGTAGRVLVVSGSAGMTGATVLAARGALRAGCGLLTCAVPESEQPVVASHLVEALTHRLPGRDGKMGPGAADAVLQLAAGFDAVAAGPGLGRSPDVSALVIRLIEALPLPLVLDADGLNALADHPSFRDGPGIFRAHPWVLTPHPGEMGRLLGLPVAEVQRDRAKAARALVARTRATVVLKGPPSLIASPEGKIHLSSTGNPGLASGGTGDVLTGMIASLIAQGMRADRAAALGAFWHGAAGDLAARRRGPAGLLASDVAEALPAVRAAFSATGGGGSRHHAVPS